MNERCYFLKKTPNDSGECILYVMSRDQRVRDNHALSFAQDEALEYSLPLVVAFNLLPRSGYRRREQYEFMVDGLKEVERALETKGIPFVITGGSMPDEVSKLATSLKPRTIYFDFSPLRGPRSGQKALSKRVKSRVIVVDTHNIVPTLALSDHEEFAAHTIRRKLHKALAGWLEAPDPLKKHPHNLKKNPAGLSWKQVDEIVSRIPKSDIKHDFAPGEKAASKRLQAFIETGLEHYADRRNDPTKDAQSDLSPYLHYGQLSALTVVLEILKHSDHTPQLLESFKMPTSGNPASKADGIDAFIEELVVRKELSDNFCLHQSHYDSLKGAKDWAKDSLKKHQSDPRDPLYSFQQIKDGNTADELWNAAQKQLRKTGKIHGYMRMYWAKKLLEWHEDPADAVQTAIKLNDTYHLDGGDPNGYAGIMWSLAGIHDRPWFDRDIYGKIRYMSANGLRKKFDTDTYISQWT